MKSYFNKIHYSKSLSLLQNLIKVFLFIFSFFYYFGYKFNRFLYSLKVIKVKKLPAFVISIGNLTTGGTGKTPITQEVAKYISTKLGKNVAILSHGYGGKLATNNVNIVSDGKNLFYSAHLSGDEPYMLASNLPDVAVVTGRQRYKTGDYAIQNYGSNILVLDDGFQHIKLHRDLNILVIDCYKQFGNRHILPAGPLREPISQIKRADKIIVVNKCPFDDSINQNCLKLIDELEQKYKKPVFECTFKPKGIYNITDNRNIEPNSKVFAFAGIAQPQTFYDSLINLNYDVVKTRDFTDHHLYSEYDLSALLAEARACGAEYIISTEKDIVKLSALIDSQSDIPFGFMKLGIDLDLESLLGELK